MVPRNFTFLNGTFFYFKGGKNMEIKQTLLMPKTSFEMRGNLPTKEPNFEKFWVENDIYNKIQILIFLLSPQELFFLVL